MLALAQGSVRVIEVAPDVEPELVKVPDLPKDVASAVGKSSIRDRAPTRRLQGTEGQKVRMRQYARQVDQALRQIGDGERPGKARRGSEDEQHHAGKRRAVEHGADEGREIELAIDEAGEQEPGFGRRDRRDPGGAEAEAGENGATRDVVRTRSDLHGFLVI